MLSSVGQEQYKCTERIYQELLHSCFEMCLCFPGESDAQPGSPQCAEVHWCTLQGQEAQSPHRVHRGWHPEGLPPQCGEHMPRGSLVGLYLLWHEVDNTLWVCQPYDAC